jgi:hypothetical protein
VVKVHGILNGDDKEAANEYIKNGLTKEEYVNLLTGAYGHKAHEFDWYDDSNNSDLRWQKSEHNTPANNKKIYEALRKKHSGSPGHDADKFLRLANVDDKLVDHVLNKTLDSDELMALVRNKSVTPDQLHKIIKHTHKAENVGEYSKRQILDEALNHPDVSQDSVGYLASQKNVPLDTQAKALAHEKNQDIDAILKHLDKGVPSNKYTLNGLLSKLPEDKRKEFIDKKLGIAGGKHVDADEEGFDPATASWGEDNYKSGEGYGYDYEKTLASSPHLSDEQAEHIKRHGTENAKLNLFNNEHIDPKHAVEMWHKWENDDQDDGYDLDNFKEHLKDEHRDSIIQDVYDSGEAREQAEEEYPFSEYVNDIGPIFGGRRSSRQAERHLDDYYDYLREKHDWKEENPNHDPSLERGMDALSEIKDDNGRITGKAFKDWKNSNKDEVANYLQREHRFDPEDDSDWVDYDAAKDEHDEKHNPKEIDYANHDEYSISDHPKFDDRFSDSQSDFVDSPEGEGLRDSLYDGYSESLSDRESEIADSRANDKMDELMHDYDYLPNHVRGKIDSINNKEARRLMSERERAHAEASDKEKKIAGFLNETIPNRQNEHEFGQDLHHLNMLKEHAEANGGSIGIDKMNRAYPDLKEAWKKHFNKPKLSAQDIQDKIDATPKKKYALSYDRWGSDSMQNSTGGDQVVFRLDHTPDSLKEIDADPALKNVFDRITETSKRSGHPVNFNTIGWARVDTSDPKTWVVDEMQSDLENKGIRPQLEAAEAAGQKVDAEKLAALDKINDMHGDWRANLFTAVINHAKKHGVERIITHSPESKANFLGEKNVHTVYKESYRKAPKQLGFTPQPGNTLPVPSKMTSAFLNREETSKTAEDHIEAMDAHLKRARAHKYLASRLKQSGQGDLFNGPASDDNSAEKHMDHYEHHMNMARQHQSRLTGYSAGGENLEERMGNIDINKLERNGEMESASNDIAGGKPFAHEKDALLQKPMSNKAVLPGHVLELKPEKIKERLAKAEEEFEKEQLSFYTMRLLKAQIKVERAKEILKKAKSIK